MSLAHFSLTGLEDSTSEKREAIKSNFLVEQEKKNVKTLVLFLTCHTLTSVLFTI